MVQNSSHTLYSGFLFFSGDGFQGDIDRILARILDLFIRVAVTEILELALETYYASPPFGNLFLPTKTDRGPRWYCTPT